MREKSAAAVVALALAASLAVGCAQATDATNFRSDVNVEGLVNSGDTIAVRVRSRTSLP